MRFQIVILVLLGGFVEPLATDDEKKTLTSRDYKKLFSQRFRKINKAIITDDEGK